MSEPLGHDIIERCLRLLGHDPHPPSCATSILASLDEAGLRIIAQCEAGLPASGGVSGEDGEMIAKLRETAALRGYTENADICGEAADRIVALLAERDGLKRLVDEISSEKDDVDSGLEETTAALSASNAELADALGLLGKAQARMLQMSLNTGSISAPIECGEIDAFLAKHGPSP